MSLSLNIQVCDRDVARRIIAMGFLILQEPEFSRIHMTKEERKRLYQSMGMAFDLGYCVAQTPGEIEPVERFAQACEAINDFARELRRDKDERG